jgi:hypothetical protein
VGKSMDINPRVKLGKLPVKVRALPHAFCICVLSDMRVILPRLRWVPPSTKRARTQERHQATCCVSASEASMPTWICDTCYPFTIDTHLPMWRPNAESSHSSGLFAKPVAFFIDVWKATRTHVTAIAVSPMLHVKACCARHCVSSAALQCLLFVAYCLSAALANVVTIVPRAYAPARHNYWPLVSRPLTCVAFWAPGCIL